MSNMQNMNSGVLPNQYLSHQNLPQLPQQYPYQQVGGCFSWFEWVAGNAKRSGGFKLASGSVLAGRSQELEEGKSVNDRHHELPMARIKKIMKMDDSVQQCVGPLDWLRTR